MQVAITTQAVELIQERGGTAALDFIPPLT